MNNLKIVSVLLMSAMIGTPFVFGAATNSSGNAASNSSGNQPVRNFRSSANMDGESNPSGTRATTNSSNEDSLYPPDAKPGECYTRVVAPTPMRDVTEQVKIKEESVRLTEVPAVMETVDEQVLVRSATQREEVVPATYKEIDENILVAAAYTKKIPVPATYTTRTERVMTAPERSYWKKGTGPLAKIDNTTGEIMCYVTDPAVYETITHTDLATAATVRDEEVAAVYKTAKRTVIDQPASIVKIDVPAEYTTTKVTKVKTEARIDREVVPAEYRTVTKQVIVGESKMEWRRVLCETNSSPALIAEIQTALNAKGYKAGEADGDLDRETLGALESFQKDNRLATGGVTYESLVALGVKV